MERKNIFKNYFRTASVVLTGRFLYVKWHLFKQTNQPTWNQNTSLKQCWEGLWMMDIHCEPGMWTVCYLHLGLVLSWTLHSGFDSWSWVRACRFALSSLAPSAMLCFLGTVARWILPGDLHSFVECNCSNSPKLTHILNNGRIENTVS